jgi:predicted nucleotidyltransferase
MRLTPEHVDSIKAIAATLLGPDARVTLFGSRVDDTRRGGDIDLMFETNAHIEHPAELICRLHAKLIGALGDRRIDILLRHATTPPAPVFEVAQRTGVLL